MTTWAIIPVKRLPDSKRRLARLLTAGERAELIRGFLDHLLGLLAGSEDIDGVLVVTADPDAAALAERYGARVLWEAEPVGLNQAVTLGAAHAAAEGATAILVLPADLPFVRPQDIQLMVAPLVDPVRPARLAAICPDETQDGTNALLLAPPGDFTFQYGPGSFGRHLAEAAARGVVRVIAAPGLRFDLDTESDWLVYNGYLVQVADE
jgi:2-phospho-L-lactate guanylyltransferase